MRASFVFVIAVVASGCGTKSETISNPPPPETGVDAVVDAEPPDTAPVDKCATVKCGAPLVCDPLDGVCKPKASAANIYSPCVTSGTDPACGSDPRAKCLDEKNDGFSEGYCVWTPCSAEQPCPVGSSCASLGGKPATCYKTCKIDFDCRGGIDYKCQDTGGLFVSGGTRRVCYLPAFPCTDDAHCPSGKCGEPGDAGTRVCK